tara:strand:+ start:1046 stop:1675 length:630 start_codon:yes stop_codon:yes gene_type:complete
MADIKTEIENTRGRMDRPIAGQSLANDPENPAPFEKAPEFTTVNEGAEFLWGKFIDPEVYPSVMKAVAEGTPIMNLVQLTLYTGFTEGKWNPDLMMMLAEPATYMIMALAERHDIPMTIYDGEMEDSQDEGMMFGASLTDAKLERLKKSKESGIIPEGILTPTMKEELETIEEPEEKAFIPEESLMSRPEEPVQNKESLMSKPVGEEEE